MRIFSYVSRRTWSLFATVVLIMDRGLVYISLFIRQGLTPVIDWRNDVARLWFCGTLIRAWWPIKSLWFIFMIPALRGSKISLRKMQCRDGCTWTTKSYRFNLFTGVLNQFYFKIHTNIEKLYFCWWKLQYEEILEICYGFTYINFMTFIFFNITHVKNWLFIHLLLFMSFYF